MCFRRIYRYNIFDDKGQLVAGGYSYKEAIFRTFDDMLPEAKVCFIYDKKGNVKYKLTESVYKNQVSSIF